MQWRVFNEPRTEIKSCVAKLNHTVWYFSYPKSLLYGIQKPHFSSFKIEQDEKLASWTTYCFLQLVGACV